MDLQIFILIWICVIGLCLGSFYNVVILRSLSGESIVFPSSKCPKCGHKLYFWHNIPILSYLLLRGKCYFCKEQISIQYPIIEFTTMVLFAFAYLKFGLNITALFVIVWLSCLLIMTVTDLKERVADCNLAILMTTLGVINCCLYMGWAGIIFSLTGLLSAALIIELIARSGYLITKSRAMGEADTYVAGALGAIFGLKGVLIVLFFSLIASVIFILPSFWYKNYKQGNKLTCISLILFLLALVVYKTVQNYCTIAIVGIVAIILIYSLLKSIKKEENRNYLPYIPALAAGALYGLIIM